MIRKISLNEFDAVRLKRYNSKLVRDVEEFLRMEDTVCEIVTDEYKSTESAAASYDACVKRMNCGVYVMRCKGRVFMVKRGAL